MGFGFDWVYFFDLSLILEFFVDVEFYDIFLLVEVELELIICCIVGEIEVFKL